MQSWSIAHRFFAGQLIFVLCLTAGIAWALYEDAQRQQHAESAGRMHAISTTLANDPYVIEAVQSEDPTTLLQPYARKIMTETKADFVTIMAPDRTRFTHRNRPQIGGDYIGSIDQALSGRTYTETYTGTLGPSVRTIAPVKNDDGEVIAMVSSGVTIENVSEELQDQLPFLFLTAAGTLALGSLVSWWISRRLKRLTLGQGPENLSQMYVFYDSVLHSVREGMVLVNAEGELVLYNDQAATLLNLPPSAPNQPTPVSGLTLPSSLRELLLSGRRAGDELHLTADRVLVVNQEPAIPPGSSQLPRSSMGTVTTFRDHTEIQELTGELQSMRTVTDALQAQTHEHSNRLHTIVSLIGLGRSDDAAEFAAADLQQSQRLTDNVVGAVDEPYLAALLVGKAAQANERGIRLDISAGTELGIETLNPGDLVTIMGNLLDNAFDAVASVDEPRITVSIEATGAHLQIRVWNNGPPLDVDRIERIFELGYSTKSTDGRGIGLALVRQACNRLGGHVEARSADDGALFSVHLPCAADRDSMPDTAGRDSAQDHSVLSVPPEGSA